MKKKQVGIFLLAGGTGKRLWPLSTALHPKYLLKTSGGSITLIEETLRRFQKAVNFFDVDKDFAICTSIRIRKKLERIFQNQKKSHNLKFYAENIQKNTMSAIATLTAFYVQKFPEITIVVSPTDQIVVDENAFCADIRAAYELADAGNIVVLGTKMKYASENFGYIHVSENNSVLEFTEKPDILTAQRYLQDGKYFVNSGIYVFKGVVLLKNLEKLQPELYADIITSAQNMQPNNTDIEYKIDQKNISIDNALSVPLAKNGKLQMIKAEFEFEDIGTFQSLLKYYNATNATKSRKIIAHLAIACTWLLRR
ncbi:MAG: hypothetical protein LBI63_02820 [Candidatus Ancillula sp.]|jgi:mannose-1-phosphate guanylyltransferase|nr:hypothetical protein [Candidatus Ancillula sp.]